MPELRQIFLIFFDHLDFKIIKLDMFNKTVLAKSGLGMAFEIRNITFQPNWVLQVKIIADFLQGMKNFVCSCIFRVIINDQIF